MIRLALSVLLVVAAGAAEAQRPSTLGMTCRQAQNLVASRGAVVLSTGTHTYDRFVAGPGYCMTAEWAYSGTARTSDSPACRLGYVCKSTPPIWYDRPGDHWFFDR